MGAHQDASNGAASGSVYVFTRSGTVWSQQQKLTPNDGASLDFFGRSLALENDTLVIGAQRDDDMGTNSGSVYVFLRNTQGVWSQHAKLTAFDGATEDNFGFTVSLSGNHIAVGAHQHDAIALDAGAAYVFAVDTQGNWTLDQEVTASDAAAGDLFGRELSIDADHLAVGAWSDDDMGADSGSVYVFAFDGTTQWTQEQKLTASNGAAGDYFGRAVGIAGPLIVVGAHGKAGQNGAAYAYVGTSTLAPNGTPCSGAGECQSGQCVDGVCCNAICGAACESCALVGFEGVCTVEPDGSLCTRGTCQMGVCTPPGTGGMGGAATVGSGGSGGTGGMGTGGSAGGNDPVGGAPAQGGGSTTTSASHGAGGISSASAASGAGGGATNPNDDGLEGTCSCTVVGRRTASSDWLWALLLSCIPLARRRRTRQKRGTARLSTLWAGHHHRHYPRARDGLRLGI